jgi:uncharacterized cupredoxin-like copper-binding protein
VTPERQRPKKRTATHSARITATRLATLPLAALAAVAAGSGAAIVFTAAPASAASSTTTVRAVETDFHIKLSKTSFTAGKYVFVVQNKGQTTHSLKITGPGLSNATSKNVQPGQSTKLTVTFKKGAYDIFCPIPGHKALGMNMNVTVGAGAAPTTTGGGTSSSGSSSSAGGGGAAF